MLWCSPWVEPTLPMPDSMVACARNWAAGMPYFFSIWTMNSPRPLHASGELRSLKISSIFSGLSLPMYLARSGDLALEATRSDFLAMISLASFMALSLGTPFFSASCAS
ncbi:hypothetical protein D3C86_1460230 [compost metagenome]